MGYKVTGIRYALGGENDSWDRKTELAEELVGSIEKGTRVDLKHEVGNPCDVNAVGVFMEWKGVYRRIGYISGEESATVRRLLGESGIGEGEMTQREGHLTLTISLINTPEIGEEEIQIEEQPPLPSYPLVDTILLQTPEREESLQVMMRKIRNQGKPTVENVKAIIHLLNLFVEFEGKSLCYEDRVWLRNMQNLSEKLFDERKSLGLTEQECDEVGQLKAQITEILSDFTTNKGNTFLVEVMEKELDEYRRLAEGENGFFEKYDTYYLKGSLEKADKNQVRQQLEGLNCWLAKLKWSELHNYKNRKAFADRLKYTSFSRRGLHEIYAVILLIERLEARLSGRKPEETETINYKAPELILTDLLTHGCEEYHSERYDAEWFTSMVTDLMASEYRDAIARNWKTDHEQKKAWVVGALKDAGVFTGSYNAIAEKVKQRDIAHKTKREREKKIKSFARYMGEGKKQKWFGWVKQYVENH